MAHYIVQFTKGGAKLKTGLTRQARDLLRVGLWGVPHTAQLKMRPRQGDGVLVAVGSPDRVFVGDAVVANGYHRFHDEEAARFPSTLSYGSGLSLTQVRVWPRALPVMAVWPKTAAAGSNPGALWFGTLTELRSSDAAIITATGRQHEEAAREDEGGGASYETNTPLTDQEREEILALLARGLTSSTIAERLGISTMRVAAIKAHLTMGTYGPRPAAVAGGAAAAPCGRADGDSSDPAGSSAAVLGEFGIKHSPRGPICVGIDVAESRKGLDLVALDRERSIVAAEPRLTVDEVVERVLALRPTAVCIDSPSGWSASGKSRSAERDLARLGVHAYYTGQDPGDHSFYAWIRVGLEIFRRLAVKYPLYREGDLAGHAAEIFPHASAALLADALPARGQKEPFRRRVLRDHGVAEHDLPTLDLVDAALAALTGLIALEGRYSRVGDAEEGVILLPVATLPLTPLHRSETPTFGPTGSESVGSRSRSKGKSVQTGYVNRNGQRVIGATDLPGTDHGQYIYLLRCGRCSHEYGSNGSDNFQRKCPKCQGGRPGLHYAAAGPQRRPR